MKEKIRNKAREIELFIMDVDGVLTDGRIILGNNGEELKCFHSQDGQGIKLAQKEGIKFAIITGRESKLVENRARELDIVEVYQGIDDKVAIYRKLLKKFGIRASQVAYIGDDVGDLPLLQEVGLSFTVANGVKVVKDAVDYITRKKGGRGGVREAIEIVLTYRNKRK